MHKPKKPQHFLAVLAVVGLVLVGCTELPNGTAPPPETQSGARPDPDQELWDSKIIWSDAGQVSAIIRAGHVRRFVGAKLVEMDEGVTVDLFKKDGSQAGVVTGTSGSLDERRRVARVMGEVRLNLFGDAETGPTVLTADRVDADDINHTIVAKGSVSIANEDDVTLETEELKWDQDAGRLNADGRVKISSGGTVEEGIGLVANKDLSEWTMRSVTGRTDRSFGEISETLER
jgi:hypothetical protein